MKIEEAITHAREVAEGCAAENGDCAYQHDKLADWLEELKAYKETGLTPEEVVALKSVKNWAEAVEHELEKYTQAEKEGRLAFLPCGVGDTVYVCADGEIKEETVKQIFIEGEDAFLSTLGHFCGSVNSFTNFGKTVFSTREAAEAALKGQREGKQ